MASSNPDIEPLLRATMRVLRGLTTAEELIAVWPTLRQKHLVTPTVLSDYEHRLLFDLPNEDIEFSNIAAVTSLSHDQLIEKAVSNRELLTLEELSLLKEQFWSPRSHAESLVYSRALGSASREALEEYFGFRDHFSPGALNDQNALKIALHEDNKRQMVAQEEKRRAAADLALPDAKEWIQDLYHQGNKYWGFVCFYDAAAQEFDPATLDEFQCRIDGFLDSALRYTGALNLIHLKWWLIWFNAPHNILTPAMSPKDSSPTSPKTHYQDGSRLRKAFQDVLKDPQGYQNSADVKKTPDSVVTINSELGKLGFLTNTFFLIDAAFINTVITSLVWRFDWRVLAFEADYPVAGRQYEEGYPGYTWVRFDQLVYNFYELRMKEKGVGMDQIWKEAQTCPYQAFVSMDPEEARLHVTRGLSGFTEDTVIGRRWYAIRNAKQSKEGNIA